MSTFEQYLVPVNDLTNLYSILADGKFGQVGDWFINSDVLASAFVLCLAFMLYCWIGSIITGDLSYVDRLWSILPPLYCAHFWGFQRSNPRLALILGVTTLWGIRLTFNFARKGGYTGHEDYRWKEFRKTCTGLKLQIFNLFFIVIFQNLLLFGIVLPAYVAYLNPNTPLTPLDWIAAALYLSLLLLETVADQQQWNFQTQKWAKINKKNVDPLTPDEARGFLTQGLFKYSRHPNFFAEQSMWTVLNLFAVAACQSWLTVTFIAAFIYIMLFQGSTPFTEAITLAKYPSYADYQATTSRLVPWFPKSKRTVSPTKLVKKE